MLLPPRPDERRVRRLALTAPSESLARRGVTLLEDALRTAVVAGETSSRVLYFRRISVGRIRAGQTATAVSLQLERQFRAASAAAVHGGSPEAAVSCAVWFADPAEPCVIAAAHIAQGRPLTAWFWRLAAPEALAAAATPAGRARILVALATRVAATEAGSAAVAAFFDTLAERRILEPFLEGLAPADAASLMDLLGVSRTSQAAAAIQPAGVSPAPSPAWAVTLRAWIGRWTPVDVRSRWLAIAAVAPRSPVRLGDARLCAEAAALVQAVAAEPGVTYRVLPAIPEAARSATRCQPVDSHVPPALERAPCSVGGAANSAVVAAAPTHRAAPLDQPPYLAPTAHAGLYFLLAVMARAGVPQADPELLAARLADRILLDVARYLRIPPDDTVLAPLSAPEGDAGEWVRVLRLWCVRYARISMRLVVRRRGLIASNRTHIDVTLPLSGADARIRRAALDLDPGWVAWFGRVVRFHYEPGIPL